MERVLLAKIELKEANAKTNDNKIFMLGENLKPLQSNPVTFLAAGLQP